MTLDYKHYFRDPYDEAPVFIEVQEPIGWDAVEFNTQRSDLFIGLENEYSNNLTWDGRSGLMLNAWYKIYAFDGMIDYKVEEYCDGVLMESKTYVINFITRKYINGEFTAKVEDSGFSRKIKNRIDTPINFKSLTSIEGVTLTPLDPFRLKLHSKTIRKKSETKANEFLLNIETEHQFSPEPVFSRVEFPYQIVSRELETIYDSTQTFNFDVDGVLSDPGSGKFVVKEDGGPIEVNYKIAGTIRHQNPQGNITYGISIGYRYGDSVEILYDSGLIGYTGGFLQQRVFDLSGSLSLDLEVDDVVVFYMGIYSYRNLNTAGPLPTYFQLLTTEDSGITYSQNTTSDPSQCDAYYIYEALNRCIESMADRVDAIRSDFFGRLNSMPTTYDYNGCGSFMATTDGKNIRNLLDITGEKYPYTISFQELYEALDSKYSLGMRIESIDGLEYLRIEPKEYFYNSNTVMQFKFVPDIERTPAVDLIYNKFEIGDQDWKVETVNGIDEPNTKHTYAIPVRNAKQTLTKISKMITGGFAIETTRRLQNDVAPTTDYQYDDKNFLIWLNRTPQTFDTIEEDPYKATLIYPHTYATNTLSERNEAFTSVTNVLSPETSYNLRGTPARCAINWYPWLSSTIAHAPDKGILFQSGEGNYKLRTEITDECEHTSGVIQEDDALEASKIKSDKRTPFFKPEYLRFDVPLSFSDYKFLRTQSIRSIEVSCSDGDFEKAFLKEMKYMPNTEEGSGYLSVTAIVGMCTQGSFDNSFDNSFDIGTC